MTAKDLIVNKELSEYLKYSTAKEYWKFRVSAELADGLPQ